MDPAVLRSTTSHPSATYTGFTSVTDMMTLLEQIGVKVICWMAPFINTKKGILWGIFERPDPD